jgi:hypothetical protein
VGEAPVETGTEPAAGGTEAELGAETEAVSVGDQIIEEETGGVPQDSDLAEEP